MPVTLKSNIPKMSDSIKGYVQAVITKEGFDIEADMKRQMQGVKHGVTYYRGGRPHTASAPGEPPARDTGHLADSIHTIVAPDVVRVMIDANYAGYLEYGTYKMAPRPFVTPAVERSRVRLSRMKIPVAVVRGAPSV